MRRTCLILHFFLVAALFVPGECPAADVRGSQVDPRDMPIDRQIGGMEAGSRIAHPQHDVGEQQAHQKVHGTGVSGLGKEAHATAASGAHHLPHSPGLGTGTGTAATHAGGAAATVSGHAGVGASPAGTGATEHHVGTSTNAGGATEGNHGILIGGNLAGGGTAESETAGGGSTAGTGSAGSQGTSTDRSIIEADTDINLSGENPSVNTDVSVDTSAGGGLLDADTTTNAGSVSQQIDSPLSQEISGGGSTDSGETAGSGSSNYIIEVDANLTGDPSLDVAVDTSAGGGLLDASAVTDVGTVDQQILSESSPEISSTSGTSSGTTSDVSIDTDAGGGLVDLDTATQADTPEQELTSSAGLEINLGADTISGESELGTEIGVGSDAPPAGEIESGLEADVEGVGATEATASDPADGLSSGTTLSGL